MVKVGILGANGRMGRVLIEAAYQHDEVELGFAAVRNGSSFLGQDAGELAGITRQFIKVTELTETAADNANVIIDFTLPESLEKNLDIAVNCEKALVIGTTGLSQQQLALIDQAATNIPIVFAANYSIGINLMLNLVSQTTKIMGDSSDIEIIEGHHRYKKDAPSGTALAIGQSIAKAKGVKLDDVAEFTRYGNAERKSGSIGFATVRGGDIVGDHTALFAALGERIEITHKASSRLTFANGALMAALWLKDQQNGLYSMQDVLGLL